MRANTFDFFITSLLQTLHKFIYSRLITYYYTCSKHAQLVGRVRSTSWVLTTAVSGTKLVPMLAAM